MENNITIQAQYEANKVNGRSSFCPREGFYQIVSVYKGICLGKPAEMANCKWKKSVGDIYTIDVFTIQLESFKTGDNPLDTKNIIGQEIKINSAIWDSLIRTFTLTWECRSAFIAQIEHINACVKLNAFDLNLDTSKDIDILIEEAKEKKGGY